MKISRLGAGLLGCAAALAVVVAPTASATSVGPNLVGGSPASTPYPFEASLLLDQETGNGPQFHCAASLIAEFGHDSWYETNAHCVTDFVTPSAATFAASQLTIAAGSNYRSQQVDYPVDLVVAHPDWDWGITTGPGGRIGDIALVRVSQRVPAQPVLVGTDHIGQTVRLIGWGLTTQDASGPQPDELNQLDTRVASADNCTSDTSNIGPGETCLVNRHDTGGCFGDSGSAALKVTGGRYTLVGSISRGVSDDSGVCGVAGDNDIVTETADYVPWMISTILGATWAHHHTVAQGVAALSAA